MEWVDVLNGLAAVRESSWEDEVEEALLENEVGGQASLL
jgi:hypothetical protein